MLDVATSSLRPNLARFELVTKFLDDWIGQNGLRHFLDFHPSLLGRKFGIEGNLEELPLAHILHVVVSQVLQAMVDGLALRVQHAPLQTNKHSRFHQRAQILSVSRFVNPAVNILYMTKLVFQIEGPFDLGSGEVIGNVFIGEHE